VARAVNVPSRQPFNQQSIIIDAATLVARRQLGELRDLLRRYVAEFQPSDWWFDVPEADLTCLEPTNA
jgi:hypothetical protein